MSQSQLELPFQPGEAEMAVFSHWTETTLLNYCRRTAKMLGWLVYHTKYSLKSDAGFPDLILVGDGERRQDGRVIAAELKKQGLWPTEGRLSTGAVPHWINGQREWLKALAVTPVETYLWWPSDAQDIAFILNDGATLDMECVRRTDAYLREGKPANERNQRRPGDRVRPDGGAPLDGRGRESAPPHVARAHRLGRHPHEPAPGGAAAG